MQLSLQHNPAPDKKTGAAFITGRDVRTWLKELSRWGLHPDEMEWYILPVSRQSPAAAGLFVIFKDAGKATHIELLEPYVEIAPTLFIPLHSKLTPKVKDDEWKTLLIWDRQVFHPVLGFIGFEHAERIQPAALMNIASPANVDWSFANPGLTPLSTLRNIVVVQPSADELIGEMKQDIGTNSLDDIPPSEDEPSFFKEIILWIIFGIVSVFMFFYLLIAKLFSKLVPVSNQPLDTPARSGWMEKLQNWFDGKLGDLQQKRDKEMERLLKMFERNQDEALKYAIPLNSPYLNRGETEGRSSRLGKRSTKFNPGGLLGGGFVETWNVDKYKQTLQEKYLTSAKKEIENKNFRRAAYIYAHLLGDLQSAANCLEQGGYYREAAALYKDHLKNLYASALCLERGKLYSEAIVLFEQTGHHEKAGDLYAQLDKHPQARTSYEKQVDIKINANDFLDAARLLNGKMNDEEKAKQTLMQGWDSPYQSEACLKKYFDIVLDKNNTVREVRRVYTDETASQRRRSFLNVLSHVKEKNKDEEVAFHLQDLAYEIVNEQADAGDLTILESLPGFVPQDKLLRSDANRYRAENPNNPVLPGKPFFLDKTIVWSAATRHGDQVLVLGERNDFLQLARINEQGVIDYFSWSNVIPRYSFFGFVHDPRMSNMILLPASNGIVMGKKILPKTRHFRESVSVYTPAWLQQENIARFVMTGPDEIILVNHQETLPKFDFYNLNGELKHSVSIKGAESLTTNLVYLNQHIYTFSSSLFYEITKEGVATEIRLNSGIRLFAGNSTVDGPLFIVSTNRGCHLIERGRQGLELNESEVFFRDLIPNQIVAISSMHFALVEGQKVLIVAAANSVLGVIKEFKFETKIVAVVPVVGAVSRLMTIEENGRVNVNSYE